MTLTRRTELRRTAIQRRALPEKPTKRHPIPSGPDRETALVVVRRALRDDVICCEVCGERADGCRGWDWSLHHRRGRDGRPDSNSVQNLLLACGASNVDRCHGRIHQRRSEARPSGWWLSRITGEDPLMVPVLIDRGSRWVYLDSHGGYSDSPPVGAQ